MVVTGVKGIAFKLREVLFADECMGIGTDGDILGDGDAVVGGRDSRRGEHCDSWGS